MTVDPILYHAALNDFQKARRGAAIEQLLARFSGRSTELLSYETVRRQLRATNVTPRGLQDIPIEKIVGSVGRYKDFSRRFLPQQDSDEHRWAAVKTAMEDMAGVPPIEVYQVGDAYFVQDGNHRVSIARQLGTPTISAYVTEVKTRVPLSADDDPDEIICKARYADFLESSNLDNLCPDADLLMTFCGHYRLLLEHIEVHRHFLGNEQERFIPYEEAVVSWYNNVYLPVIQLVESQGILRYFPDRTVADMYVMLAKYRAELAEALGWDVAPETAVTTLTKQPGSTLTALTAIDGNLIDTIVTTDIESFATPGQWRTERLSKRSSGRLFDDVLVPLEAELDAWRALDMGIWIAHMGQSRLLGLHVTAEDKANEDPQRLEQLEAEFYRRCTAAGVEGQFALDRGKVANKIVARSIFADGVVFNLNHPPASMSERYQSGLQMILDRCPRPLLTLPPGINPPLNHALLAYGGNPITAAEALYVSAYLAARYEIKLSVVSVGEEKKSSKELDKVADYLAKMEVSADLYAEERAVEPAIIERAANAAADFIIIGGPSFSRLRSVFLGSTANRLLAQVNLPLLICR